MNSTYSYKIIILALMTGNEETLKNTPKEKVSECSLALYCIQKWHPCLLFQCSVLSYYHNFCQPGDEKFIIASG